MTSQSIERQRKSAMAYRNPLAMLSVMPLCSGAPLNPRLQEFLTWFLDHQRTIDRSIESGSTVVEDTTTDTTTESNFMSSTVDTTMINIASTTKTVQITTTTATPATSAVSACEGMISISLLKYIGLLLAFLIFLCIVGLVVFKTMRWCRNRKSKLVKQPDVEEGRIEQDLAELDGNRTRPCKFWYPEMQQNKSKSEGFVTLSDSGEVVDVKYWSMQQLDAYFAEKSCLKDKEFLH